jgi:hypothetical protein
MSSTITALTSGGGLAMAGDTSGQLELKTNNGTTAVTVTTAQNVGIGTTSPTTKLNIGFTGADAVNTLRIEGSNGSSERYAFDIQADGANTATKFLIGSGGGAPTERMRITSYGGLLINETSESYSPYIQATGNTDNYNIAVVKNTGTNYSTGARLVTFVNSTNAISGVISHSGVTSVTYGTSSDERLKENIVDAPNALDKVMDIKIRSYDWKEDSSHVEYGLVAQELNSVYGEPVGVGGDDVAQNAWSIEYGRLTPILLKAIQELNAKVDAQALEIQALKGVA